MLRKRLQFLIALSLISDAEWSPCEISSITYVETNILPNLEFTLIHSFVGYLFGRAATN